MVFSLSMRPEFPYCSKNRRIVHLSCLPGCGRIGDVVNEQRPRRGARAAGRFLETNPPAPPKVATLRNDRSIIDRRFHPRRRL